MPVVTAAPVFASTSLSSTGPDMEHAAEGPVATVPFNPSIPAKGGAKISTAISATIIPAIIWPVVTFFLFLAINLYVAM
ncbi:MAG: hypothetical protein ACP5KE_09560 [Candidatus Methanodesulfokora sp.]